MPRLFLIHGNLDVPTTFAPLLPFLPDLPTHCLDMADTFRAWPTDQPADVVSVTKQLAEQHSITAHDVVIGHSMTGCWSLTRPICFGSTS
jgi:pimeloyl-ACP methyl ester carboxylesterase